MILLIAIAMAQAAPTPEAEALGVRLAQTGTLAALMPVVAADIRDHEIANHPEWSDADKAAYRQASNDVVEAGMAQVSEALGHAYATRMSVEDLRAAVTFNESPAGRNWRSATPGAVMEIMTTMNQLNFGEETRVAFCKKTGKLCSH